MSKQDQSGWLVAVAVYIAWFGCEYKARGFVQELWVMGLPALGILVCWLVAERGARRVAQ